MQIDTTAQKIKFSIKDFFSKCDQIRKKLQFWSHLLKKSLMENVIFCATSDQCDKQFILVNTSLITREYGIDVSCFNGFFSLYKSSFFLFTNQWTGFYMITVSIMKELREREREAISSQFNYGIYGEVRLCDQPYMKFICLKLLHQFWCSNY